MASQQGQRTATKGMTLSESIRKQQGSISSSLAALKQVYGLTSNSTPNQSLSTIKLKPGYGLCCCCLENICHKSIWKEYVWLGSTEVYGNMVSECFKIEFPDVTGGSNQICEVCIGRVRSALKFRRQLLRCQTKLQQRLITPATETAVSEPRLMKIEIEANPLENKTNVITGEYITPTFISPKLEFLSDASDNEGTQYDAEPARSGDRRTKQEPSAPIIVKTETVDHAEQSTSKTTKAKKKFIMVKMASRNIAPKRNTLVINPRRQPAKRPQTLNDGELYTIKTRLNACLMIRNSTICPFRFRHACFKCFYCEQQYAAFRELKTHCDEVHDNVTNRIIIKRINRPNANVKADVSSIKCKLCHEHINSIDDLIKHLTETHNMKFNYKDASPNEAITGYDMSDNKNRCAICKQEFAFFKTLSVHMNEHSNKYVCESCGRCFLLESRLKAHVSFCHDRNEVVCNICSKTYASKQILMNHLKYTHEKRPCTCSICGDSFANYKLRLAHFVTSHGKERLNLRCELCDKEFSSHSTLKHHNRRQHLKVYVPDKYECDECSRKFKDKSSLRNHMIIHTGERNHECHFCHKKYARLKSLREHLKIHNNDKRWSCSECGQAFVQKCSLRNHIRVHHSEFDVEELIVYKKPE